MRIFFLLILLLHYLLKPLFADSVNILFVYGSKPKAAGESHWFGGLHGGHVSVSYKNEYISFVPSGSFHVFPKDSLHSEFVTETEGSFIFDTTLSRYLILSIPITRTQRLRLDSISAQRLKQPDYDYAFFGFRCASSSYEILASAGILPAMSKGKMIRKFFYPKRLRTYLCKMAIASAWRIDYRPGRKSRKWERDGFTSKRL